MRLWVTSDWHLETWRGSFGQPVPEFDVLVGAGDVSNNVAESIEYVAAVADGWAAVFVAGNHEYWNNHAIAVTLEHAYSAATRHNVAFLECYAIDIGGVRFAGATLWTEDDVRFQPSLDFLALSGCDAWRRSDVSREHVEMSSLTRPYIANRLAVLPAFERVSDRIGVKCVSTSARRRDGR